MDLYKASKQRNWRGIETALNQGADIETYFKVVRGDGDFECMEDFQSPLMIACKNRDLDSVMTLLEHGANINAHVDTCKYTPLLQAAERGHCDIVKYLLDHGADVAEASISGRTPLMAASAAGQVSIVKLLLDNGADIDKADCHGLTSLMASAANSCASTVQLLLQRGANAMKINNWGQTAHGMAAMEEMEEMKVTENGYGKIVSILEEWIQEKNMQEDTVDFG